MNYSHGRTPWLPCYIFSYNMGSMAKVMISLPDDLLTAVDAVARAEHCKRSEFFKNLAVRYLRYVQRRNRAFADLEAAAGTALDFWDNPTDDELWNDPATR